MQLEKIKSHDQEYFRSNYLPKTHTRILMDITKGYSTVKMTYDRHV